VDKRSLKKHIDTVHKKIRNYECPACSNTFQQKPHLTNHVKRYHFGLKEHCEKCGSVVQNLHNHIRFVHNNVKNFPCKQCDKRFQTSTALKKHINSNHSKFKVCCLICEKIMSEGALRSHIKMVHLKNNKNTLCLLCERKFDHKGSLRNHIKRSHLQVKEQCQKCGLLSKDLFRHNRYTNCIRKGYVVRNRKSKEGNGRNDKTSSGNLEEETIEIIEETEHDKVLYNTESLANKEEESNNISNIASFDDKSDNIPEIKIDVDILEDNTSEIINDVGIVEDNIPKIINDFDILEANIPEISIDVDILEDQRTAEKNERLKRWEAMKRKWNKNKRKKDLSQKDDIQEIEMINVKNYKQNNRRKADKMYIAPGREGTNNEKYVLQKNENIFNEKRETTNFENEIKEMGEVEMQNKWERWKQKAVVNRTMKMIALVGTSMNKNIG